MNQFEKEAIRRQHFNKKLIGENGELNLAQIRAEAIEAEERRTRDTLDNRTKYFESEKAKIVRDAHLFTGLSELKQRRKEESADKEFTIESKKREKNLRDEMNKKHGLELDEEIAKRKRLSSLLDNVIREANAGD